MMRPKLVHSCQNQPELLRAEIPTALLVKDIMFL